MATQAPARDAAGHERGRDAERPRDVPVRGWVDVALRVKAAASKDNASLVAAGLALYALLAVFPALTATISLYGLFASPERIAGQIQSFSGMLPEQAASILSDQMQSLASQGGALGFGAVLGILIALWSARKGMTAIMAACNIAYNEEEQRGMVRMALVSLALTFGAVVGFLVILLVAVAVPIVGQILGIGGPLQVLVTVARWVLLWGLVVLGLAVVYRYAPDREPARWRWVTPGAAVAATLWIVASVAFAVYVRNFGSYGAAYGSLGGVIVLLLWLYLSGYVVVLGAELNAELERQTRRDTTRGEQQPAGERGAEAADALGDAQTS
ncbi:MAG: YihY/virulence factor BrkB family protein [Pseudomonadota bacterium]